jgi:hypothetical protein
MKWSKSSGCETAIVDIEAKGSGRACQGTDRILARSKYPGFNNSHLTEKLVEVEKIAVSRETGRE